MEQKILLLRDRLSNKDVIDVTTHSELFSNFAPDRDELYHFKRTGDFERYSKFFFNKIDKIPLIEWNRLLNFKYAEIRGQKTIILGCFCQDNQFCHTHLLIDRILELFPEDYLDYRVTRGLILGKQKSSPFYRRISK